MKILLVQMVPLAHIIAVLAVAALVLVVDLIAPADNKKAVGRTTVAGILGVLAATWLWPVEGAAFGSAYVQDAFSQYVHRIVLSAALLGTLGALTYGDQKIHRRQGEYHVLLLCALSGMMLVAGAKELILLVVGFELMSVPLYALAALEKSGKQSTEGALKLFMTGAVSSAVMLYGLSFVMGATGTTIIPELAQAQATPLLALGLMLTIAGMGFKVGAVPFHMWVPDTYQAAPTPFVAFLSVAPKAAAFAAFVRLFLEGFGDLRAIWWPILLVVAIVTLVMGNLLALPQNNVKRLLAYSGIGHIGLLLVAFGIGTVQGIGVMLFYLAAYVFTNMGAFLVIEVVGRDGNNDIKAFAGLSGRNPGLALAMLVFLLSLGGIPFMAGFWAKLLLFWAVFEAGLWVIVLLGASMAVLALFYYLRVGRSIYIDRADKTAEPLAMDFPTTLAISLAAFGVVLMGVWPGPFVDSALEAAQALFGG